MNEAVKVSIKCAVYNHNGYIRECLQSFVMQKTNFKFEVIVHDDASTDGSADIIREFADKYPDIIKPIFQDQNKYSTGISVLRSYIEPNCIGEYHALCEGDDRWISEDKLQKQVDYLDANPDCYCVVHSSVEHNCLNGEDIVLSRSDIDRDFSLKEIVDGGGGLFSTNSIMIRKEVASFKMPSVYIAKTFGDYQIPIYSAILGRVHYMTDCMSLYNKNVKGSWSAKTYGNIEKCIDCASDVISLLTRLDEFYNYKYNDCFIDEVQKKTYERELLKNNYRFIIKNFKKSAYFKQESFAKRMLIRVGSISPKSVTLIRKVRKVDV